jgi:hypothetical protein
MTVDEFDTALSDLETRVDRLRALYENWFRGYEKLEPAVARRDVERRVYGLRKELPRNTALRFRYHQLYQRYTTLATYWQRTARQIEEGTYRRQLQRIKRRRDDDQARTLAPPPRAGDESSAPPPAFELDLDETLDVRNLLDDFDLDQVASALEGTLPAQSPVPAKPTVDIAAHVRAAGRVSVPDAAALAAVAGPTSAPEPAPRTVGRFARPSLDASKDLPNMARPTANPPPIAPANDVAPAKPVPRVSKPPAIPATARGTGTVPLPPPPTPARSNGTGSFNIPAPPGRVPPPPPARSGVPPVRPAMPSPPTGTMPLPPRPAPPAAAKPAARQTQPSSGGPSVPAAAGLDEARMRRIYEEYAAAKRKNNEAEVRFETLQGSIQKMLPDLTKRHQGKQIDFEVVVKDGRVGLKPKAT